MSQNEINESMGEFCEFIEASRIRVKRDCPEFRAWCVMQNRAAVESGRSPPSRFELLERYQLKLLNERRANSAAAKHKAKPLRALGHLSLVHSRT
jgi:hypothetical protein